jgi:hypothetical protein
MELLRCAYSCAHNKSKSTTIFSSSLSGSFVDFSEPLFFLGRLWCVLGIVLLSLLVLRRL